MVKRNLTRKESVAVFAGALLFVAIAYALAFADIDTTPHYVYIERPPTPTSTAFQVDASVINSPIVSFGVDAEPTAEPTNESISELTVESVSDDQPVAETMTVSMEVTVVPSTPEPAPEPEVVTVSNDDTTLLAKIIYMEAGSDWLSDEWKMAVGEVVLNRVASPEFPNTIYDVIYQRGQYANVNTDKFANLVPSAKCTEIAQRLMNGERVLNCPSVVFQSQSVQGGGVYTSMYDSYYGTTYFCYSNYPSYY